MKNQFHVLPRQEAEGEEAEGGAAGGEAEVKRFSKQVN